MEKCSLCGGKIVNHRCVDCGMPYPEKPHYTLRSETAHTHNVNGEEVLHRVRSAAGKDPVYTCDAEDEQDRIDLGTGTIRQIHCRRCRQLCASWFG